MKRIILYFSAFALLFHACRQASEEKNNSTNESKAEKTPYELLSEKIEADSTDADLYLERARLLLEIGQVNEALGDINSALMIDENYGEAYIVLSDAYMASGKLGPSLEALQKAEELSPENTDGLLKQAELYLILREYESTFEYIKKSLRIDDFNPVAYFIRGYALLETGDTLMAVRDLMKAVEQDQQYFEAYMQLGYLYSTKNDPIALDYFRNAANARPGNPEPYYSIGMFYQQNEQIERAVEAYEQLLAIDPDYADAYYNLGYLNLVYIQDFERAIIYFTDVIQRQPKRIEAYYNRGYCHELAEDYDAARTDYKNVLEMQPDYDLAIEGMNRIDRVLF